MTAQQRCNFAARNKKVTIMNTKYTIKNFRVFDENGVTVDIKPITILTGCNSSGKSSIVKSMVLLDTYLDKIHQDYIEGRKLYLNRYFLDFSQTETSSLGNFLRVVHKGASKELIDYSFNIYSPLQGDEIIVNFTFGIDTSLKIREGYLYSFSISNKNGDCIFSMTDSEAMDDKSIPQSCNLNLLKDGFLSFVYGQNLISHYRHYESLNEIYSSSTEKEIAKYGRMTKEEVVQYGISIEQEKELYCNRFGNDSLKKIINWSNNFSNKTAFENRCDFVTGSSYLRRFEIKDIDVIRMSERYNTLFYTSLLKYVYDDTKEKFRDHMYSLVNSKLDELNLEFALEKIVKAFEESNFNLFGEFYNHLESLFLMEESSLIEEKNGEFYEDPFKYSELEMCINNPKRFSRAINFKFVYEVLANLDFSLCQEDNGLYLISFSPYRTFPTLSHKVFAMFRDYVNYMIEDTIGNLLPHSISYIGTSLVNIKRMYALDEKDHFTQMLKSYIDTRREQWNLPVDFDFFRPYEFIDKWIQRAGLGQSIRVVADKEGLGVTLRLHKSEDDETGELLAEQGYGVTQFLMLLLRIETAIMKNKYGKVTFDDELYLGENRALYPNHIDYAETTISIEEPEVHLHPKMQSMLAEILVDAYTNYNVHFIIETHSEYIIRKLQLLVANKEVKNSDISLLYVYDEKDRPGYEPQVKKIGIRKDGMLNGTFGEGFFDEADMLSMFLLTAQGGEDE